MEWRKKVLYIYKQGGFLVSGGERSVYEYHHHETGHVFAAKIRRLPNDKVSGASTIRGVRLEAKIAQEVHHVSRICLRFTVVFN